MKTLYSKNKSFFLGRMEGVRKEKQINRRGTRSSKDGIEDIRKMKRKYRLLK